MFGITELEGCVIRHYFSEDSEDYVKDLRAEFPDFFKCPESQEYLNDTNSRRKGRSMPARSL